MVWFLAGCGGAVELPDGSTITADDTVPEVVSTRGCDACGGDCELQELAYDQRYHATGGVDYVDVPPAGGPHDPCWADFGVHAEPLADERWVHNLEHGAVVLLHDCATCDDDVAALEAFAAGHEWALSTPYPALDAPFALVAWEVRATMGCWDPEFTAAFYDEHRDRAPESVLAGTPASCR
jgi:hypothetical protein